MIKRFWQWLMYDCELKPGLRMEREIFLTIAAAPMTCDLQEQDAKNVVWTYLQHRIKFVDAYMLLKRKSIPDQWKDKLVEYSG